MPRCSIVTSKYPIKEDDFKVDTYEPSKEKRKTVEVVETVEETKTTENKPRKFDKRRPRNNNRPNNSKPKSDLEDKVIFNVNGFGHGVGMSQYGANYMAQQGLTFKEILLHYYPNTEIK